MVKNTLMKSLTGEWDKKYEKAVTCYMCHEPFHEYSTSEHICVVCNECNPKRQCRRLFLPLIFHNNAKGYEMHPLLQEVSKKKYGCKFDGIPNSNEKPLSLTVVSLPSDAYSTRVTGNIFVLYKGSEEKR